MERTFVALLKSWLFLAISIMTSICGIQCAPGADKEGWMGRNLLVTCQGKMTDSSYCQDLGGPHSRQTAKWGGGSFKAMGTENNLCVHWQFFGKWTPGWLPWNSVNVPMSPDKQRLNLGTLNRLYMHSHHPCVPSFCRFWWIQGFTTERPIQFRVASHPKTMQDAPRSLGARKNSIR